jgi:hypothetical protein
MKQNNQLNSLSKSIAKAITSVIVFVFTILPSFTSVAIANSHVIELPPITVIGYVDNGWTTICVGPECASILGFDVQTAIASMMPEIGEGGGSVTIKIKFYPSKANINCGTTGEVRTAEAPKSVGAFGLIFLPIGSLVQIAYSNGQTETFMVKSKLGTNALVPIIGSCV